MLSVVLIGTKNTENEVVLLKAIICEKCGSNNWAEIPGYRKCKFCGTIYQLTAEDAALKQSTINIQGDVQALLEKCKSDPYNARKYANLILDIDPNNQQALYYLRKR